MKRIVSLILAVLIGVLPIVSFADNGYLFLKLLMEMEIVNDVDVPSGRDVTTDDSLPGHITAFISMENNWISIDGYDINENHVTRAYTGLSEKQLYLYAMSILLMYDTIDSSTTRNFGVYLTYGSGEDDFIYITDADTAREMHDILNEVAQQL